MDIFRFKQFSINQSGCAMKINTDGVLLGALANGERVNRILDIGTGTGVIALMLAQRFINAHIHAVEINEQAAQTAAFNFKSSAFQDRLGVYPLSFEHFFEEHPNHKYDLIASNPPFYINSLSATTEGKTLAKHADAAFFERLTVTAVQQLKPDGLLWLILPVSTAELVKEQARQHDLYLHKATTICSYAESAPHREILAFGLTETEPVLSSFIIYQQLKQYSAEYRELLKDFFMIF